MSEQLADNVDARLTRIGAITSNRFIAFVRISLFFIWVIVMIPVRLLVNLCLPSKLPAFFMFFHRGVCRIFALRCNVIGQVSTFRPSLFLANHISYWDVIALGAHVPTFFIAKSEVANWPVFGTLAKLQNTLFVERRGNQVRKQLSLMSEHFNQKQNLLLFAEGTSTEGEHVEPFKSSLLQSVSDAEEAVYIQPITIAYTHYKNKRMDRNIRDQYAWYGSMPFGSHFLSAAGLKGVDITIHFHQPVSLGDFCSRKACANHCQYKVATGLEQALAG